MICMRQDVYNAAVNGEIEFFEKIQDSLDHLLTPNKNTILHVYITSHDNMEPGSQPGPQPRSQPRSPPGSETEFVKAILDICPLLIWQCNTKGETPLHIAARYGHAAIVGVLIDRVKTEHKDLKGQSQVDSSKEMLRVVNKWKDTALHEAVRYHHLEVVKRLLSEDPDFEYPANKDDETILYMAVERRFNDVASEILKTCKSVAYTGPLGRTALHAAAFQHDLGTALHAAAFQHDLEMIEKIIGKHGDLTKQADQMGFTPLHLAAGFNHWRATKELLKHDREVAYMKDKEGRTTLHIAAYESNYDVVKEIVSSCPDCCELVDNRGWNVLHFSVACNYPSGVMKLLLENPSLKNLLNEKDLDGNTPFLLYSKTDSPVFLKELISHFGADMMAFNNQNLSASEIAIANESFQAKKSLLIGLVQRKVSFRGGPSFSHEEEKPEGERGRSEIGGPSFSHEEEKPEGERGRSEIGGPSFSHEEKKPEGERGRSEIGGLSFSHEEEKPEGDRGRSEIGGPSFSHEKEKPEGERGRSEIGGPSFSHEEKKPEGERGRSKIDVYDKVGETHLVVAALITTMTFAAGITMPGGFMGQDGPHPGSAILARSAAFKAFLITDTISMLLSLVAILALTFLTTISPREDTSTPKLRDIITKLGFFSIVVALGAMTLAFVTGTYAVLAHHSMGLAVAVCLIGLSFFPISFFMLRAYYRTIIERY